MKTRGSMILVLFSLTVIFTLSAPQAATAQPGTFVKGVLQPLKDGFPNRPITIINIDDPGTDDGIYARHFQEALAKISPVPILVSDEPSPNGGTWYKVVELRDRVGAKEGYYTMVITPLGITGDLQVEPLTKELGVKLDDINMVIQTESTAWPIIQRKNAPWGKTWAGMVKYGKANPGKLRYVSKEVGSAFDIGCEWIIQKEGLKVQKMPQGDKQQVASTIGAGEGDFSLSAPEIALPNWEAGAIDVTLFLGPSVPAPWDKDPNVVTGDKMGYKPLGMVGSITGIGVIKEVPQAHVDWLYKLFLAGTKTEVYKNRVNLVPGLKIRVIDGKQANKEMKQIYDATDQIVWQIGLHIPK